jgi:hypothetical protein
MITPTFSRTISWLGGLGALFAPQLAFAQGLSPLMIFFQSVSKVLAIVIPVLVALAVAVFFWGLIRYLWSASNPEKASENKNIMYWGVIAIFVMVSLWGLVLFIGRALNIGQGGSVPLPTIGPGTAPRSSSPQTTNPQGSFVGPNTPM